MANYNRCILIGRLTRDPKLSYTPQQTAICEIGLAVGNTWTDKDGQKREDVCFIDCRCFGKQAETLNQYMSKGRQILVEGRLDLDQWETPDGQKRSKHRVAIQSFQFLDSKEAPKESPEPRPSPAQHPTIPGFPADVVGDPGYDEGDIPF